MMHRVVKPFPCSWDGFTLVDLNEGDERDFGGLADGLVAEGWIEPIEVATTGDGDGEQTVIDLPTIKVRPQRK
ncbi:hypothetical protein DTW90_30620 [Neorhizobium sp. P12A]|uniref:hypothetical protein n=1 Tax=Neorhizobium sp. P12A TaxID=2268027 RepID=UPI0011EE1CE1|nr:hypothetical protein [Neorhizobium sp. P12A]KAA0689848.1 hypothetical protein DTW90_30620 [Neorhizobium sp. P12A]